MTTWESHISLISLFFFVTVLLWLSRIGAGYSSLRRAKVFSPDYLISQAHLGLIIRKAWELQDLILKKKPLSQPSQIDFPPVFLLLHHFTSCLKVSLRLSYQRGGHRPAPFALLFLTSLCREGHYSLSYNEFHGIFLTVELLEFEERRLDGRHRSLQNSCFSASSVRMRHHFIWRRMH